MTLHPEPPERRSVLIGLIGEGVAPSLTPPMHEREGARHGLHYVYRTIDLEPGEASPERIERLLASAERLGYDGLNITHPIKQTILPLLDELSPGAERVGAVNTVVLRGGRRIGHNTDVTGFGQAFDEAIGTGPHGRIVLVGAGGAGAAVATALASRPVDELVIVDVDEARAAELASATDAVSRRGTDARPSAPDAGSGPRVRAADPAALEAELAEADGIVNATPFGMAAHPGTAFDPALLEARLWVADIVYRPALTRLLAEAAARGCRTMSGLGMAMGQAADAFEIFTGETADRRAMLADLRDLVAAEAAETSA